MSNLDGQDPRTWSGAAGAGPAPLVALPPHAVPTLDCVRAQIDSAALRAMSAYAAAPADLSHAASRVLLAAIRAVLPRLPDPAEPAWHAPDTADDAVHDSYFRIRRVPGPAGAAFVRSVVDAARAYHADCAEGDTRFDAVRDGLAALLGHLAETRIPARPAQIDGRAHIAADPMRRWIVGHQVFAALTQGIVFSLLAFEAAMPVRPADAEAALDLAARLMRASAAAFRFTGDFAPAVYRDVIRPSMGPAHVGDGFSGLLSADHRALIHTLGRVRPLMAQAQERLAPAHARLTAALQLVYADHKFVCARFDGSDLPSLRGSGEHGSGVDQLDRFARARQRLLRPAKAKPRGA